MRSVLTWLMILLVVPGFLLTGATQPLVASAGEYADGHLIICFKPGVAVPAASITQAQGIEFENKVLAQLKAEAGLIEVRRFIPELPLPGEGFDAALSATARHRPESLAEVSALLHKYGQDRTLLLRFARSIDPPRLAQELMRRYPELIEFAEPDHIRHLMILPDDQFFNRQWHLRQRPADPERRSDIRAPEAWDMTTGSPDVIIAVIDSGLDMNHPDIVNKVFVNPGEIPDNQVDEDGNGFIDDVSGWDFTRRDNLPDDENGHGTWVSGIAAAETNNELDVAGVSWGSRVLPLKVGDAGGSIFVSLEVQAINYALTFVPQGVRVINMSFGGPGRSRAVENALRAANEAGIVAIAAAGNGGRDAVGDDNDQVASFPSNYSLSLDNVVAVAATDRFNSVSRFSNFGRESVDVGAPGEGIFGLTSRDMSTELGRSDGVFSGAGTSPATAIVSGIATLIYSEFPDISPLEVKRRLRGGVDRFETMLDTLVSGGRVNAFKSLEHDDVPPAPITDLRVVEDSSPVTLTWTATGDDGREGRAAFYDIRFLTVPLTSSNLRFAQKVSGVPFPQPAGASETLAVPAGLIPRTYYFLIRVFDNVGHMAESNQIEVIIPE